jgi:heptosyltransferase-2
VKILVRATNWIGDAVMSLPALRALRARFPEAEIVVLAKPWVADLYQGEKSVDRIVPLPDSKWLTIAGLRAQHFDLSLLFPNSFASAAIDRLIGARRRIGYARDGRGFLLTDAIPRPRPGEIPKHETYYYLELLRRANLISAAPQVDEIRFDGAEAARNRGEALFVARGLKLPVVGVSPGAAYGSAKTWLPERFADSAAQLAARTGASIAIFGAAGERDLCARIAAQCGGANFAGATSLREFIDMTAACSLFLANDSGSMHIAAGLGVPSVTVFGPTDETATGPLGPLARVVRERVECAPCKLRECPIDHRCMTGVTAARVVEEAVRLISIRC